MQSDNRKYFSHNVIRKIKCAYDNNSSNLQAASFLCENAIFSLKMHVSIAKNILKEQQTDSGLPCTVHCFASSLHFPSETSTSKADFPTAIHRLILCSFLIYVREAKFTQSCTRGIMSVRASKTLVHLFHLLFKQTRPDSHGTSILSVIMCAMDLQANGNCF